MKTNLKISQTINETTKTSAQIIYVTELGKASTLILGKGNKRQEANRTPQITNIEKCAS
jgi:hypothetical protein